MTEEWISGHEETFDQGKGLTLAITAKEDGTLIGAISLMGVCAGHRAELGYWVGRQYWNQGFCTEAAQAILRYAFEEMGLVRVHACHLTRNPSSGCVLEKIGMQHEGRRRQHVKRWDVLEDLDLYGILRTDWRCRTMLGT